jgi:DNA polymerase III epsilon subunit-like protein
MPHDPQPSLFVIDTETNGFSPAQLIELAIVGPYGTTVFDALFRVDGPIHPRATELHGFVVGDLLHYDRFEQRAAEIYDWLEGAWVLGYNVSFDQTVLEGQFRRSGLMPPRANYRDLTRPATRHIRGPRARFPSWRMPVHTSLSLASGRARAPVVRGIGPVRTLFVRSALLERCGRTGGQRL